MNPSVYETHKMPPRGKGDVRAYSKTSQTWRVVNWKYVYANPDVYPRWQPTASFRWVKQ